jgi:hypothetical protein
MKIGPRFEDYDWTSRSVPAYCGATHGPVMVEYDDNLLFDDEVVGQALSWSDYATPSPFDYPARKRSRRK